MPRPKENRVKVTYRVAPETPDRLNQIVIAMGFVYSRDENGRPKAPAVGEWLDAIADGRIKLYIDSVDNKSD